MFFVALGVQVDVSKAGTAKQIILTNKPGRVDDILQALDETMEAGWMSKASFSFINGSLAFARSQTYGRAGLYLIERLRKLAGNLGLIFSAKAHAAAGVVKEFSRTPGQG